MWIALLIGALLVVGLAVAYPITLVVIIPLIAGFVYLGVWKARKDKARKAQKQEQYEESPTTNEEPTLPAHHSVTETSSPPNAKVSNNPAIIDISALRTPSIATQVTIPNKVEAKPKAIARLPASIGEFDLIYNYQIEVAEAQNYDASHVSAGDIIEFRPEPDNGRDGAAVALFVDEKKIGYMHKDNRQSMYNDFIRQGDLVYGVISIVELESIKLLIGYYEKNMYSSYLESGRSFKTYKLTANKNADMQENISYCSVGERIAATYDYEKDKYIAVSVVEIGYFPKSAEDYLGPKNIRAYIHEIGDNEDANDTLYVKVAIF